MQEGQVDYSTTGMGLDDRPGRNGKECTGWSSAQAGIVIRYVKQDPEEEDAKIVESELRDYVQ
jgi:hypothetical protein